LSPLARGLRLRPPDTRPRSRIIPARAGFTVLVSIFVMTVWDHPRSRGVYGGSMTRYLTPGGSSPLARGLPERVSVHAGDRGIIPARAGFTDDEGVLPHQGWDHPRSRGVYGAWYTGDMVPAGSSPLARGLHWNNYLVTSNVGIIPARAGFTYPLSY